MIKINKDISQPPESLIPAVSKNFPKKRIPHATQKTHQYRTEIIANKKYYDVEKYNRRYKYFDIKERLLVIYNSKCAYCEHKLELLHIEHYRPKTKYYWLAYSWDNLLLACPTCNQYKRDSFAINGNPASFYATTNEILNINVLSASYDKVEKPLLVNPEITDPAIYLCFKRTGEISSTNDNFLYTIDVCKLDRKTLRDARRKILEDFKNEILAEIVYQNSPEEQKKAVETLIRRFVYSAQDTSNEFIAFRKYSIDNKWLNEIVKEALSS